MKEFSSFGFLVVGKVSSFGLLPAAKFSIPFLRKYRKTL